MTALVAAGEKTMDAGKSDVLVPQSKQLPEFSKDSPKNNEGTKEVALTMTENSQNGTIDYYLDLPSEYRSPRPVEVWLPEVYNAESGDRYPVLYMHDGQFLFHHGNTPFEEKDWLWDVDTTMSRLIENGEIRPAITIILKFVLEPVIFKRKI
jgi:enterochelin esterase-like enzyme